GARGRRAVSHSAGRSATWPRRAPPPRRGPRSWAWGAGSHLASTWGGLVVAAHTRWPPLRVVVGAGPHRKRTLRTPQRAIGTPPRSEEHTSELQSRENLVCRLLPEKKKRNHDK